MPLSPRPNTPDAPPPGRAFLTVGEVAARLGVTDRHIVNLIEDGQMGALGVSGHLDCLPVPKAALNQLAIRLKVTPEQLLEFIHTIKPDASQKKRSLWRIPVESYVNFLEKRRTLNLTLRN